MAVAIRKRAALLGLCALPFAANAASASVLLNLQDLAKSVDAASDALVHLARAMAEVIKVGGILFSNADAALSLRRLKDIDAKLNFLTEVPNSNLVNDLSTYLAQARDKSFASNQQDLWMRVIVDVQNTLRPTADLLESIKNERSDFVLEDDYNALLNALSAKIGVLSQLSGSAPPRSAGELGAVEALAKKFDQLRTATRKATKVLSGYIKNHRG